MLRLQNCSKGDKCLKGIEYSHFIFVIFVIQGFWGRNPKYRGGNVKGKDEYDFG